jgi:serine/threonine protein kinase
MDESGTDRDPLDVLAEDFVVRQRQGQSPSVDEYVVSHPELAEEITELFPTIAAMERLKARSERSADGLASLGPMKLERLGDFRIIREIGRGGMGIVFEAEQESLGRRVALKVLPRQALLEHQYLARFRREARIASQLHHTNIVQVYGVGEQEGFHYYVMQYVQGVGLDRVITSLRPPESGASAPQDELLEKVLSHIAENPGARRPTPSDPAYHRFVAGVGAQVADALAYAHEMGTLHRDIKPSNLMLDDQGVVWIADFGLARATAAVDVTQAGELTGTLRYMAPERLAGRADERSDIYALGLTLYELLLLQPAWGDCNRFALIHRISEQTPSRPRSINPLIPQDLETIVLKAISREPHLRYPTAAAMAQDLRRFLEDRPVLARRIGPAGRLWRWCRRNKAVASLAASTLILLLAVAVVATVGFVHTRNALSREAVSRRSAEAVASLAGESLDRVFTRLGPSRVVVSSLPIGGAAGESVQVIGQPAISAETAVLLEEMLPYYDRLSEQTGDDPTLQIRVANATRRIGDIHLRLGHYDSALRAYQRAIDLYAPLMKSEPGEPSLRISCAEAYNELGKTNGLMRKVAEAQKSHQIALEVLGLLGQDAPPGARFELARTHFLLGLRVPREPGLAPRGPGRGPPPPPGQRGRPRPDAERPPDDRPPSEPEQDPDRDARIDHLQQAIGLLTALSQDQPKNPEYRDLLARCYREIAPPNGQGRSIAGDKALEILEALVRDFPQIPDYRLDLCETYAATDAIEPGSSPPRIQPGGEERLRRALELSQQLTSDCRNVPEYQASQARIYHRMGEVYRQSQRLDEAEFSDRAALEIQSRLAQSLPDAITYQVLKSAYSNSLSDLLYRRGKLVELRSVAEGNIADTTRLLSKHPELWYLHALLVDANRTLAEALRRTGMNEPADRADAQAQIHQATLDELSRPQTPPPPEPRP